MQNLLSWYRIRKPGYGGRYSTGAEKLVIILKQVLPASSYMCWQRLFVKDILTKVFLPMLKKGMMA